MTIAKQSEDELAAVTVQRDEALMQLEIRRVLYELKTKNYEHVCEQRDGLQSGIEYATEQLVTITAQRNRLAEALQKLADCDWVITLPDRMDAVRDIARGALQSLIPTTMNIHETDAKIHETASWFDNGTEYRKREGYIEARNNLNPNWIIVDVATQPLTNTNEL
jgi:hypothetical protein